MNPDTMPIALTRDEVVSLCVGTAFVVMGLGACAAAAIRRRRGVLVFFWLGAWSTAYGLQDLGGTPAAVAALPQAVQPAVAYVKVAVSYLLVVVATLAWRELARGGLRLLLGTNAVVGAAVAVAGIGSFVATGDAFAFQAANSALAVFGLLILVVLVVLPAPLADRYLSLRHRGVLAAGTLLFAVEALWANLSRGLGHSPPRVLDALGFAVLLFSFGYVALQSVMASEQRLASIESELAVARRLQLSILPTAVPQLAGVRVAAAYEPMTAVARDFYEFIPVDSRPFEPGDRFLLYTDGLIEAERASGEAFGDARLEQVLRESGSRSAPELVHELLAAVGAWRPPSAPQQDDITLLVVDSVRE